MVVRFKHTYPRLLYIQCGSNQCVPCDTMHATLRLECKYFRALGCQRMTLTCLHASPKHEGTLNALRNTIKEQLCLLNIFGTGKLPADATAQCAQPAKAPRTLA